MTLADIALFAARKVGLPDTQTIAEAKIYAQLRWKMIWDHADWKQAHLEILGLVPVNVEEVELPPEVELVKAVRIGGNRELLPSSQITQIGVDPAGIGTPGSTYAFSPVARSSTGAVRIRLHRPLHKEEELLFMCKRKCVELVEDTDQPLIPGSDQCLISFVTGDLLEWLRQFSKAAQLQQQAMAMLAEMVQLETIQTATTVRFVPFVDQGGYSHDSDWLVSK